MHHALSEEGFGIRIRPVRMDDAAFIVWLRHQDHARGMLGDSASDVAGQEQWVREYFGRPDDYYFIAETFNGIPVGTTSIYGVSGDAAETGRFVVCPDVPAAFPISVLTYDLAFERMKLHAVRATSVASNRAVHSYVRKLGFQQTKVEKAARFIGGQAVDILHFALDAATWFRRRITLLPLAQYATEQILDWEKQISARGAALTCATP